MVVILSPRKYPRILVVGPGRAGKDEALLWFEKHTPYASGGTTSLYLAYDVAEAKGISVEEAYAKRHEDRNFWFELGNKLRETRGVLYLLKQALLRGNVVAGVRDNREIEAAIAEKLVDVVLWIDNSRVPHDPTMTFNHKDILRHQRSVRSAQLGAHSQQSCSSGAKEVFVRDVTNEYKLTDYHINLNKVYWEIGQWWENLPAEQRI